MNKYYAIICLVNSRDLIVNEFTIEIEKDTTVEEIYYVLEEKFQGYKFIVSLKKEKNKR